MNCIIVDDDFSCVNALAGIIQNYCPQLQITGTANTIADAVKLIHAKNPELVFLDVEINDETGFDLFRYFPSPTFEVVFTTAHEKYALKAIKSSCYDFLLKPVVIQEMITVVDKLEKEKQFSSGKNIGVLLDNLRTKESGLQKIAIPSAEGYSFVDTSAIISLEADGKYTKIITDSGLRSLSTKNIGEFEELLGNDLFFRTHKSWIVNLNHVKKFLKNESQVLLSNDTLADVSSRKKDEFLRLFDKA
ncbi:MAG: DNA-binding response regulator [Bacteroidetes bacterium]|jgi:two-component system LytT family response regulator|nr:DNA-binding response regulator [Bacteroidota bacterium]